MTNIERKEKLNLIHYEMNHNHLKKFVNYNVLDIPGETIKYHLENSFKIFETFKDGNSYSDDDYNFCLTNWINCWKELLSYFVDLEGPPEKFAYNPYYKK